ncbi:hypothetical protein HYS47_01835 [Candidatus Woesearchaeota archaeon]|nr:hypothetical protein [Candidatus Woesearchaeota archaeon]
MIKRVAYSNLDREALANTPVDQATQIDDHFDYSKVVVRKPWGYEYLIYQNELVAVWILYIKKGYQTSVHCHPNKKTSLIVLSGEAICSSLQENIKRVAGEGLLIDKATFHQTTSVSEEGIFVMEIETPVNKRDLVRLRDKYGRQGKGYETIKEMSINIQNYNYISLIEPSIYYNTKKKFGSCSISLATFKNYQDFKDNFKLEGWDAVSILKGRLLDDAGNPILDVGDTIDIHETKQYPNIHIDGELEVIIIKKRDTMIKLSDYIISFFEKKNVHDLFVSPGSTNIHLIDSVGKNTHVRHVCMQTEQAVTLAAEAHAKLTNKPAVAILAAGVSGTNSITGVADAWVDSTPLVIVSGQSDHGKEGKEGKETAASGPRKALRQLGIQELNIIDLVQPITKYAISIRDPNTIHYHLEKALHLATTGRHGPVWIDIPLDLLGMNVDEDDLLSYNQEQVHHENSIIEKKINEINETKDVNSSDLSLSIAKTISLVQQAKRPVLLLGNGVRLAGAEQEALQLASMLSIPVLTSRRGADLLPDSHPFFFGRPGAYGQRSANFIIQNADVLLVIGSRLSLPQIGRNYKTFARKSKLILVDIDPAELEKKTVMPFLPVRCDAKQFVTALLAAQKTYTPPLVSEWIQRCISWQAQFSNEFDQRRNASAASPGFAGTSADTVDTYSLMKVLSNELQPEDIITIDGGSPLVFAMQSFAFKQHQRLLSATGLENPAFAIPAAIGACIGSNGRNIICICEDHGFQKHLPELETIASYKLPVKIIIINSKGPSYIRRSQKEYFGGRYVASDATTMANVDISKIGEAYGIPTFSIAMNEELSQGIQKLLTMLGPCICNVIVNKDQEIIPRMQFTVKPDGKWVAKPLEDMYPYLEREKLREHMLIDVLDED